MAFRPLLVVADEKGNIYEDPTLDAVGREGNYVRLLSKSDFIPLPEGSDFFFLPKRKAIGYNPKTKKIEISNKGIAVCVFNAPAHTQTTLAAWIKEDQAPILPLFAYTTVAWYRNKFYTTAIRIDPDIRQDIQQFNQKKVISNTRRFLKKYPNNRLLKHLIHCATVYLCPAARNYFLNRWEAPSPTSPTCNSRCKGCISYQPKDSGFCSTQERITFIPTPEEIAEIAIDHLNTAPNPIVSFGQGCEGEPLMVADVIAEAIKLIRQKTQNGIINLNTNGSKPEKIQKLIEAGLDSARISINSFIPENYKSYYSPVNYTFEDVLLSIQLLRRAKRWVSINYFVHPGYTNHPDEIEALNNAIRTLKFNMIQWRNFNIDPDYLCGDLILEINPQPVSIKEHIFNVKRNFPWLYHGYFNPGKEIILQYNF